MYKLIIPLINTFPFLNVFKYITFRIGLSALTAMLITIFLGPYVISKLKAFKIGQEIQRDSLALHELHKGKKGTPTMGGILFTFSVCVSTILWADISRPYILIALSGILLFGLIGFADDLIKIMKKNSNGKGLKPFQKFGAQAIFSVMIGFYLIEYSEITGFAKEIFIPFIKGAVFSNSTWIYMLFIVIVITGTSNAVNLTDGLDGLAAGCSIVCSLAFTIICYVVGNKVFCDYLYLEYISESAELTIFCSSMVGAGLGFLWFNVYPAQVFMGDTGALSIGGALGVVAVLVKKEFYLILIGGVFVIEALSVIIQVTSFKLTGKRVFLCAPFHHHLQLKGWQENKITVRLWLVSIIFALLGLCSLKLR